MMQYAFLIRQRLNHEAQQRRLRNERIVWATINAVATITFSVAFAIFGWAAAYLNTEEPVMSPFPEWMFTLCLSAVAFTCFIAMGYYLFAFLDECFFEKNNSRRITGKR